MIVWTGLCPSAGCLVSLYHNYVYVCIKSNSCRPCSDVAFCGVWSGSTLFVNAPFYWMLGINGLIYLHDTSKPWNPFCVAIFILLQAFVENKENPPAIWAHETFPKEFQNLLSGPTLAYYARGLRQFGVFLPTISAGIGLRLRFGTDTSTFAPLYPTKFVEGSAMDVTLAGMYYYWTASRPKMLLTMRKKAHWSSCSCANCHSGICSLCLYLNVRICPKTRFRLARPVF